MIDVTDLIGTRFKTHGRNSKEGFDCYGLAIEVSRRFGHTLEDLWYQKSDNETFSNNAGSMLERMNESLKRTERQKEGNLVIFEEMGRMVHIGVILEENIFIHCDKYGCRIEPLNEYFRKQWKVYEWLQ